MKRKYILLQSFVLSLGLVVACSSDTLAGIDLGGRYQTSLFYSTAYRLDQTLEYIDYAANKGISSGEMLENNAELSATAIAKLRENQQEIMEDVERATREFMAIAERVRAESAKAADVLSAEDLKAMLDAVNEQRYREAKKLLEVVMSKLNSGSMVNIKSEVVM